MCSFSDHIRVPNKALNLSNPFGVDRSAALTPIHYSRGAALTIE